MSRDRGLVAHVTTLLEGDRAKAEEAIDAVMGCLLARLHGGYQVAIPGVGVLRTKVKRKRIVAPGPHRGMAVEERIAQLAHPNVISSSDPYEVL